jgi:hypothetical protein
MQPRLGLNDPTIDLPRGIPRLTKVVWEVTGLNWFDPLPLKAPRRPGGRDNPPKPIYKTLESPDATTTGT